MQVLRLMWMNCLALMWCAVGVGFSSRKWSRRCSVNECGLTGWSLTVKNSPGIRSVVPKRSSNGEAFMSSLYAVLRPNSGQQLRPWDARVAYKHCLQRSVPSFHHAAALRVVRRRAHLVCPISRARAAKRAHSNCGPWSVVMVRSVLKRAIQYL